MNNAELIESLRYCFEKRKTVVGVPWYVWCDRAADAIQTLCDELATYHAKSVTDEKRIVELNTKCADLQSQINEMENEIEELLPKEGEWIVTTEVSDDGAVTSYIKCSRCGFYWREPKHGKVFKTCPNCGARMKDHADAN